MARELAILVTAKNMASGVLKDVRGDVKGLQSEAKRGLSNTARNVGIATAAAAGIIAVNVKAGIDSLAELERVNAQTTAVLKSSGNTAGGDAQAIRDRAEALEKLTTVDDKVIQNAENLLLTFTNVREDAFEPTLQAALDMNAAMGGDDESLQGVLIQVGKAVNDPIKGLTALSRVGVSFTEQQKKQIKAMVEAGDAAGAQQIILAELNKEFSGSAAAQADTYAGKMRRVEDAVEGAQQALAVAFLPVLEKVADKLEDFLSDPDTLKNIEGFGETLAGGLDSAIEIIGNIPWDSVGSAFELMGKGAKAALDMFTSMPDWVQTAVITGWGLNKLSGGALGNIVGQLASGLIKGVLNMNAAVVNVNGKVVNGPGGGPGGGGPGGMFGGLVFGAGLTLAGIAAAMTVDAGVKGNQMRADTITTPLNNLPRQSLEDIDASIRKVDDAIDAANKDIVTTIVSQKTGLTQQLQGQRDELVRAKEAMTRAQDRSTAAARDAIPWAQRNRDEIKNLNMSEGRRFGTLTDEARRHKAVTAAQAARLSSIESIERGSSGKLSGILAKKTSIHFAPNLVLNNYISATMIQQRITRAVTYNGYELTSGI